VAVQGSDNVNEAPEIAPSEGGAIVVWKETSTGTFQWFKISATVLADAQALAASAVQPDQIDTAAAHPEEDFVAAQAFTDFMAAQALQVATMQAQIDSLNLLVGSGSIVVFEANVFETGVFT
jgi:hypothetical protein